MIAVERSESDAKTITAKALRDNPSLTSRRPPAASSGQGTGFSKRDMKVLSAWEMTEGFRVAKQETYLGGHLGPKTDYANPHPPYLVAANHPWYTSHPNWWDENIVPIALAA